MPWTAAVPEARQSPRRRRPSGIPRPHGLRRPHCLQRPRDHMSCGGPWAEASSWARQAHRLQRPVGDPMGGGNRGDPIGCGDTMGDGEPADGIGQQIDQPPQPSAPRAANMAIGAPHVDLSRNGWPIPPRRAAAPGAPWPSYLSRCSLALALPGASRQGDCTVVRKANILRHADIVPNWWKLADVWSRSPPVRPLCGTCLGCTAELGRAWPRASDPWARSGGRCRVGCAGVPPRAAGVDTAAMSEDEGGASARQLTHPPEVLLPLERGRCNFHAFS